NPVGIHFEPGVWLSVPATTVPAEGATIVRMASIPHGTTIEAQGASFTVAGGPRIDPVDITPFPIGSSGPPPFKFPSQTATDTGTFRLPQDLTDFIAAGTITQEILDNPNIVLKKRAAAQNITSTTVIVISTNPADPLFGGGTDNIAFLLGDKNATTPNADAVQMSATFWIETVTEQITVPAYTADQPVIVRGATSAGNPVVRFSVTSQTPTAEDITIDVSYTQIQYTQTVLLNFNRLTWPHVSVATLVPNEPVPVAI
ncbi:MAG: heme-binding protein, partial [Mycobacteriaceae bacterium]